MKQVDSRRQLHFHTLLETGSQFRMSRMDLNVQMASMREMQEWQRIFILWRLHETDGESGGNYDNYV